jgi:hypothetical protein
MNYRENQKGTVCRLGKLASWPAQALLRSTTHFRKRPLMAPYCPMLFKRRYKLYTQYEECKIRVNLCEKGKKVIFVEFWTFSEK